MATNYNPSIVTSGLVLCLDAGNTKSYPGTGTTWTDLSGNANTGTLQNSPTYSSSNAGYFSFNGSNQYVTGTNASSVQITGNLTLSAWVVLGDNTYQGIISKMTYSPYNGYGLVKVGGYFAFWTASGNAYTYTNSDTTYVSNSNWFHVVGVRTAGVNRIFINGVKQIDSQSPGLSDSGAAFVIGRYYSDATNFYAGGKIALARIYNTALTDSQVLQNYNALRGRFGL
jgi:hypothetical protein